MLLVLLVLLVEVVVREREEEARGRILSPEGIAILSRLRQPPVSTESDEGDRAFSSVACWPLRAEERKRSCVCPSWPLLRNSNRVSLHSPPPRVWRPRHSVPLFLSLAHSLAARVCFSWNM